MNVTDYTVPAYSYILVASTMCFWINFKVMPTVDTNYSCGVKYVEFVEPIISYGVYIMPLSIKSLGEDTHKHKQVDILISKNQVLQILYLKHCVYKTS